MKKDKERIDVLLVETGLAESREKAKRAVMAGIVFAGNERVDKPGTKVDRTSPLEIKGETLRYVGRGGLKLEKALSVFNLDPKDKTVLDIGASTGGFTDCCLQHGAERVYALDVGYNQLAWKLRTDLRVIVMERTNFRYAEKQWFTQGLPDFATIDVSFISLKLILPPLAKILQLNGNVVALVKPQFEAGREQVGRKGIVKDARVHEMVVRNIVAFAEATGFAVQALSYSPITGGDGNIEFLLHLRLPPSAGENCMDDAHVRRVVEQAHREFSSSSSS
ncbi:MAG TPA: TlyA family RNA methyltransferase [Bacillales bacterium]|nr:TlyA family RNA methyltransferase [Bacillales bacterium]